MKKKKQNEQPVVEPAQETAEKSTTAFPMSEMSPSDELQIYYNDAYMREKQRFNDMFGIIERPEEEHALPSPETQQAFVAQQPKESDDYVPVAKYEKMRKKRNALKVALAITITVAFLAIVFLVTNSLLF